MRKGPQLIITLFLIMVIFFSTSFSDENQDCAQVIIQFDTEQPEKISSTLEEMKKNGDECLIPLLKELLKNDSEDIRIIAADKLRTLADPNTLEALENAVNDEALWVRQYAAVGIAHINKINPEKHLPIFINAVLEKWPNDNTEQYDNYFFRTFFDRIITYSNSFPPELIEPVRNLKAEGINCSLFSNILNLILKTRDPNCIELLIEMENKFSESKGSYTMWYKIKKTLAEIEPDMFPFNNPAADIIGGKITRYAGASLSEFIPDDVKLSLVKLGDKAVDDLEWALTFDKNEENIKIRFYLEVLGEIGTPRAIRVIKNFLNKHIVYQKEIKREKVEDEKIDVYYRHYSVLYIKSASIALLTADANQQNIETAVKMYDLVKNHFREAYLLSISEMSKERLSDYKKLEIFKGIYKAMDTTREAVSLLHSLYAISGPQAGQFVSDILVESTDNEVRTLAIYLLTSISYKNYDAVPTLIKALDIPDIPFGQIARAFGDINDIRAIPALKKMEEKTGEFEGENLWIPAALAKFGCDYEKNAKIIRDKLPDSMHQAGWLNDTETIRRLGQFIDKRYNSYFGAFTLQSIGTKEAFEQIKKYIEGGNTCRPYDYRLICEIAEKMADEHQPGLAPKYNKLKVVAENVYHWFPPETSDADESEDILYQYPLVVRKLWANEVNARLDEPEESGNIPAVAEISSNLLENIMPFYDPELIPVFEKIIKEYKHAEYVQINGDNITYHSIRSIASKILSEKTGKKYMFIDVDGQEHPGGWTPQP